MTSNNTEIELQLHKLSALGYKFTRPLVIRDTYLTQSSENAMLRGVILDTETTSTNYKTDKVIELGMVAFDFCPKTGLIGKVHGTFNQLEDPGFPIPAESTKVHHITDDMVKDQLINDDDVNAFVEDAVIIIAHNARFDRQFVEPRFDIFKTKAWGCSFANIDWSAEGLGSAKLEFLAYRSGFHYEGHRASTDCHALLEVLHCAPTESGIKPLKTLLDSARVKEYKISALQAPFDSKDLLKAKGYRWNAEDKVWSGHVSEANYEDEAAWLRADIYFNKGHKIQRERIDVFNRFSDRKGQIEVVDN